MPVEGFVASDSPDTGKAPVKVGGVYRATPPTFTDLDAGELQVGVGGALDIGTQSTAGDGVTALAAALTSHSSAVARAFAAGAYAFNGASWERLRTANVFKPLASTAITAGTGATIWTPAGGKKFRVLGLAFSSSAAGQLLLGDNVVGTVIARSPTLAAGGVWQLGDADIGNGILSALANNVLKMDGPTGNIAGMVWGTEE